jgi:hypothetical protein
MKEKLIAGGEAWNIYSFCSNFVYVTRSQQGVKLRIGRPRQGETQFVMMTVDKAEAIAHALIRVAGEIRDETE